MHGDAKSLRSQSDALFSSAAKQNFNTRNQAIADQFFVERADFTAERFLTSDYADHLMSGYPSMVRRDLANAIGSMLRPKGQPWFHASTREEERGKSHEAKQFLEYTTKVQRRAMYDPLSQFTRATKEADNDYTAFGGGCVSVEVNKRDTALIYRCWHLRDVSWMEDSYGQIVQIHRNWSPTVSELIKDFPDTVHPNVRNAHNRNPHGTIKCRHIIIRADDYDWSKSRHPWVSVYIDLENEQLLEEVGSHTRKYVLPRWMTVSGSQYPLSPATTIALPDARLMQAMTLTMLDAGERAANPPMIGVSEAIRSDLQLFPNGFTAIDADYDERLGEVLRPLNQDSRGLPFGLEMLDRTAGMLREQFYLNTISMPPTGGPDMTAFEVGQRVQEHIRQSMPIFEPIEADYNGPLCEMTFETLMHEGSFGPVDDIPEQLRGEDVSFRFESPLAELVERQKGQLFLEAQALIASAANMDESAGMVMDFKTALHDVLDGIGSPAQWLRSKQQIEQQQAQQDEAAQAAQQLAAMQQGAQVADTLGSAAQRFDSTNTQPRVI